MEIFITGGSGFIGRNLVEYLSRQHNVYAPSHAELELLDESAVKEYFKAHKFDVVIHGAVRPGHRNVKDPSGQLYNNLSMFFNIMRNEAKFGKLIFLSSGAVYDVSRPIIKANEDSYDTCIPRDEYGLSKYVISKYISKLDNVVELRIFGIFGKYEDYTIRFISNAICKTIFNLPITLKQNRRFDYLFIEDFISIIEQFITKKFNYKIYNVTPDNAIELLDLAEKVKRISGKSSKIIVKEEGMGMEYSGDNSRLKNEISDFKFTPIDSAIKKLYEWYAANKYSLNKKYLLTDK
jgi:GDP-L-fucose synthase